MSAGVLFLNESGGNGAPVLNTILVLSGAPNSAGEYVLIPTPVTINPQTGQISGNTGPGTGDVVGPASSTDNAIARFDLATGKLIQNSAVTISDVGNITQAVAISGAQVLLTLSNTATAAASSTTINLLVGGAAAGDAYIYFAAAGGVTFALGLDNSANAFVIAPTNLGTSNLMSLSTTGAVTFAQGITATTGNIAVAQGNLTVTNNNSGGAALLTVTNSSNTANSVAAVDIITGGASAGSPYIFFGVTGGGSVVCGYDIATGNFCVSPTTIGTANNLTLTSAGALSAKTSITATLGAITTTNGNFVNTTSGTGRVVPVVTATGAASGPVTANGRVVLVTFTGVSIAAGASLTLQIANSSISNSGTIVNFSWSGATVSSALSAQQAVTGTGTFSLIITNGTGATTSIANVIVFAEVLAG